MMEDIGRVADATGLSQAEPQSAVGLGPSGFDPSRGVFLKRAVAVDAWQFLNNGSSYNLLHWINQAQYAAGREFARWINDKMHIPTLEGVMQASIGDWIIRGVKGEFYPCKPDVFAIIYERIGDFRDAAIATETRRAETPGSVEDEGAGPKDIAQKEPDNGQ